MEITLAQRKYPYEANEMMLMAAQSPCQTCPRCTSRIVLARRLRNGGQQFVRVEHVHVNDGGQAVIGNVKSSEPCG